MKIYNVTFDFGDTVTASLLTAAAKSAEAKRNIIQLVILLSGKKPRNIKTNVIVFGADGSGKSLNKVKELA
jgi:hypothetical protein